METNLVLESIKFMVLGMGTVFLFLVIMIYTLKLQTLILGKYFPEKPKHSKHHNKHVHPNQANHQHTQNANASHGDQGAVIAAITAAISEHKKLKG